METLYQKKHLIYSSVVSFFLGAYLVGQFDSPELEPVKIVMPEVKVKKAVVKQVDNISTPVEKDVEVLDVSDDYHINFSTVLSELQDQGQTVRMGIVYRYADLAMQEQRRTGFPASLKLAQMIVESGFREGYANGSAIFQSGNNPFGIRYWRPNYPSHIENWSGLVDGYVMRGDDKFCKFKSIEAAFQYHSDFVMNGPHYKKHITTGDWKDVLRALEKGGYAEEGWYMKTLESVIKRYKLYLLDKVA